MVEVYVSKLRKLVGAGVLATRAPGYLLQTDPENVDIARFERLLAEGREALAAGNATLAARTLTDGLSLWRGPPLDEFAFEPFAQAEIGRLDEARLLAEEARIEAELELGAGAQLVVKLEELVARAPFRERFRAQLMLALYRAGRQADALAAYRAARETLVDELGVEPSPALRKLERAILAQEEWLVGPRALEQRAAATRETRRPVTVLVVELATGGAEQDPEALRPVMDQLLERAEEVLRRHGAAVERIPDETVMAVFGSPIAHEDDAVRSLRAVAELQELAIVSRAAVETGEVLAGGEATVRGPVVRTAVQLLAHASRDEVLAGESTRRLASNSARFEVAGYDGGTAWRFVSVLPGVPARPLVLDAPLVGRRKDLAELREALAQTVTARRTILVTVIGEAGIGKSRLAREFVKAAEPEARVLTGRCLAYGDGITYWPLREVIGELAPDDTVQVLNALLVGLPESEAIAHRLAAATGLSGEVYPVQEVRWAARRLFEQLARERPLILVFEDVHWAEPAFLDLLTHLVEVGEDASILVVCLARPDISEEHAGWRLDGRQTLLTLEALSSAEAEELVAKLDPTEALHRDKRARILDAAEGNPLFLEQMVAFAAQETWPAHGFDVPPTLQALLAARLDRLGPGERAVVECAGVVGREFWAEAVAELVPAEARTTLLRHLAALERREFVEPEKSTLPFESAYRFRHVLIQEAAYRSLPKERRAELHERFAVWLERTPARISGDEDEILGYHLEQAVSYRQELGPPGEREERLARRAAERLASAGRRGLARGDAPAAANLLDRALALLPDEAPDRIELMIDHGVALGIVGELSRAEEVLSEAETRAEAVRDERLEARALLQRSFLDRYMHPEKGSEGLLEAAERAIRVFERERDDVGLSRAWRLLAEVHWSHCQIARMEAALEEALARAERAREQQEILLILDGLARVALFGPMPVEEAAPRCEEIRAQSGGHRGFEGVLAIIAAYLEAMQGRFPEARAAYEEGGRILAELGAVVDRAGLQVWAGEVEMLAGDLAAAERLRRSAFETLEKVGERGILSTVAAYLGATLHAQGRDEEAIRLTEISERTAADDDLTSQILWRATRAKALARNGNEREAESLAREAVALAQETDCLLLHADALMSLAEVLIARGAAVAAAARLRAALVLYEAKGNVVSAAAARARLESTTVSTPVSRGGRAS